ncbi:MAG: M23 family metallopeptidase [Bdellovibrionaceae bacterium]|nr:M23 family metallopeptidase [Pseudobdellovibrionaceae bacterium]
MKFAFLTLFSLLLIATPLCLADEIDGSDLGVSEIVVSEKSTPPAPHEMGVLPINSCITSDYGLRRVARMKRRGAHLHTGIDLRTKGDVPLKSFMNGVVESTSDSLFDCTQKDRRGRRKIGKCSHATSKCGKYVEVKHRDGLYSLYCHLSKVNVHAGQEVTTETVIAISGQSGDAKNNPHLHFSLKTIAGFAGNHSIDPKPFLPSIGMCD